MIVDNLDLPGVAVTPDEAEYAIVRRREPYVAQIGRPEELPAGCRAGSSNRLGGLAPGLVSRHDARLAEIAIRLDLPPARVWTRHILLPDG